MISCVVSGPIKTDGNLQGFFVTSFRKLTTVSSTFELLHFDKSELQIFAVNHGI